MRKQSKNDLNHTDLEARRTLLSRCVNECAEVYVQGTYLGAWHTEEYVYATHQLSIPLPRNLLGGSGEIHLRITTYPHYTTVAFSGTDDLEFWLYNLDYMLERVNGFYVHSGYKALTQSIIEVLTPYLSRVDNLHPNFIFTGHSAGGAVATLIPVFLAPYLANNGIKADVITFGAPKVGDPSFAENYPFSCIQFRNPWDLVPYTPFLHLTPASNYQTSGTPVYLGKQETWNPPKFHRTRLFFKYVFAVLSGRITNTIRKHHSIGTYVTQLHRHIS